jgi:AAA+ superfamily predicted ATPase
MTTFRFNTSSENTHTTNLLVYMATKATATLDLVSQDRLNMSWKMQEEKSMFELGCGVHAVLFEDSELTVRVEERGDVKMKNFNGKWKGKTVEIEGMKDVEQMNRMIKEAEKHMESFLIDTIGRSHLVYDAKNAMGKKLEKISTRTKDSVFLKQGELDKILTTVKKFLSSKDIYAKCHMPYKLNILLHGLPGSGKTSIIAAVATEFKLDVLTIPFSSSLNDESLCSALNKTRMYNCSIVVLEDVDCLFELSRKQGDTQRTGLTLSGLLNCMDGMLRTSGLIMFLTANLTDAIDAAVLRSARVDLSLHFTHADEFQTKSCFEFYASIFGWKRDEWPKFWDGISCLQFSMATVQQFFFQRRDLEEDVLSVEEFKSAVRNAEAVKKVVGGDLYS